MREFLKGLDLDQETIDTIMAEHGKLVTKDKEEITDLRGKLDAANKTINSFKDLDVEGIKKELQDYKDREARQKADEEDAKERKVLSTSILEAIGDKKFASEYVQNGILEDVRKELSKPENKGKGVKELVESLTKDKDGIFVNPNKPADMPGMGEVTNEITKEAFDKMSYKERIKFKQENPEQFKEFNK